MQRNAQGAVLKAPSEASNPSSENHGITAAGVTVIAPSSSVMSMPGSSDTFANRPPVTVVESIVNNNQGDLYPPVDASTSSLGEMEHSFEEERKILEDVHAEYDSMPAKHEPNDAM